jgi:ribosome-associated translation inhibitor RaiA
MANDTATTQAGRGTRRETVSIPVTPVDERRFESEIRRMDTMISDEKKNREKFETRIEKAVNDLRIDTNARFDKLEKSIDSRFEKVDSRFEKLNDKLDSHFKWMMGFLVGAVLIPIALQYFAK